jgi:hypothetical protein
VKACSAPVVSVVMGWKKKKTVNSISENAFVTNFPHWATAIPANQAGFLGFGLPVFLKTDFIQIL